MMEKQILKTYLDPSSPGGLGGINRIRDQHKNIPISKIKQVLQSIPTYTKHKTTKKLFRRRKVNVHMSNYLWQADLVCLQKYKRQNSFYQYILTVIDTFSRKAYAEPVKFKTGKDVTEAFKTILTRAKTKCSRLQIDNGTEFYNKTFKNFLQENNITMFSVHSELKACVIERFNRTLMMRLQKHFDISKRFRYVDVLQDVIKSYNNSLHRTIGKTPNQVNKYNEMDTWIKINKDLWEKKLPKNRDDIKVNDFVRIRESKSQFNKGYAANFSGKIYKVQSVQNTTPVTYKLFDSDGDSILGAFYKEELSKVII